MRSKTTTQRKADRQDYWRLVVIVIVESDARLDTSVIGHQLLVHMDVPKEGIDTAPLGDDPLRLKALLASRRSWFSTAVSSFGPAQSILLLSHAGVVTTL